MAPGTDVNDLLPDTALSWSEWNYLRSSGFEGADAESSPTLPEAFITQGKVLGSLLFQFTGGPNADVGGPQRWSRL